MRTLFHLLLALFVCHFSQLAFGQTDTATMQRIGADYSVPSDLPVTVEITRSALSAEAIGLYSAQASDGVVPDHFGWRETDDGGTYVFVEWWEPPTDEPGIVTTYTIPPNGLGPRAVYWSEPDVYFITDDARGYFIGTAVGEAAWAWRERGDCNADGDINAFDVDAFVLALTDPAAYYELVPLGSVLLADVNADGMVNGSDIQPFMDLLAE